MIGQRVIALFIGASFLSLLVAQPSLAAPDSLGSCASTDAGAVNAAYFSAGTACYGPFTHDSVVSVNDADCYWVQVAPDSFTVTRVGPDAACPDVAAPTPSTSPVVETAPLPVLG